MSEQPQQLFAVEKIYLKDLSLEIPNAPQVFGERDTPKIDISLSNEARALEEGVFEVVLTFVLNVLCGNVLYPYLRETISNIVARGGFPPFFLNHVSFDQLYQQRIAEQQRQQQQQQQSRSPSAPAG